jgi:uncharacterized protein (TIRG00374 family)
VVVGYGAAAVLSWLFLRNAEWRVLLDGLRSVGWLLLTAAVVVRLASLVVSCLRWRALLAPIRRLPLGPIVMTMMMGMAISALVSMQAAEVARPYLLSKRADLDFSATVATVAVEWFLDLLAVLALFIPVSGLVTGGPGAGQSDVNLVIIVLVVVSVASLAALRWVPRGIGRVRRWVQTSGIVPQRLRERIAGHVEQFGMGLAILDRPKGIASVAAYSLLTSFLVAVSAWLALLAFGLPVSFLSGFVILGLVTIGGMIPTPGAVGGFHAVCQLGLVAWLKLDPARTVAAVIGLHAVLYVPPAAIGAVCFLWARTQRSGNPA